jgi:ketosteroid isomerase-like protein
VENRGSIRPTGRPSGGKAPRSAAVGALLVIAVAAATLLIRPQPISQMETEPTLPPAIADPAETAIAVVRDFELAMAAGDARTAASLFTDDFVAVMLPGLVGRGTAGDGEQLANLLGFYAGAADLSLGDCTARAGDDLDIHIVTCPATSVSGPYPETVIEPQASAPWIRFTVEGDRLRAVLDGANETASYPYTSYCIWAEQTFESASRGAFRSDCSPIETPGTAEAHREMAAAYLAAGSPDTRWTMLRVRRSAGLVDLLLHRLARNEAGIAAHVVDPAWDPSSAPGFLGVPEGSPPPEPRDFLAWAAEVYDIEAGECSYLVVDDVRPVAEIHCDEAVWSGPLVEAAGLDAVVMSTTFTVSQYRISDITGVPDPRLAEGFAGFCERAPESAAAWLAPQCTPVYTEEAGRALRLLVEAASGGNASPSGPNTN